MIGYLDLALRLIIWFLLTADLSLANIAIGVCIALILPRNRTLTAVLRDWLNVLWEIIVAIPTAYAEAIRSEEHTSELQSQSTISYAVFCLKKKKKNNNNNKNKNNNNNKKSSDGVS